MKANELREDITSKIVASLENGKKPWQCPWFSTGGFPRNAVTSKNYRGINVLMLLLRGFSYPLWGSFNQWRGKKCFVRKGEKGTPVVYYGKATSERTNDAGEKEAHSFMFLKHFTSFNLQQVDGEYADKLRAKLDVKIEQPDHPTSEQTAAAAKLLGLAEVEHGGNRACYIPALDKIQLPHPERFRTRYSYFATSNHELVHWSGAESRLKRLEKFQKFGSMAYAFEELVAEMGGCFTSAAIGLPVTDELENHASYVEHWLSILRNDNTAIFKASSAAAAASDYLLQAAGLQQEEEATEEAEEAATV